MIYTWEIDFKQIINLMASIDLYMLCAIKTYLSNVPENKSKTNCICEEVDHSMRSLCYTLCNQTKIVCVMIVCCDKKVDS